MEKNKEIGFNFEIENKDGLVEYKTFYVGIMTREKNKIYNEALRFFETKVKKNGEIYEEDELDILEKVLTSCYSDLTSEILNKIDVSLWGGAFGLIQYTLMNRSYADLDDKAKQMGDNIKSYKKLNSIISKR